MGGGMKTYLYLALLCPTLAFAAPPDAFFRALNRVEAGGRCGAIMGDNGAALGPFQIHESYWRDSGVMGAYRDCGSYAYSVTVVSAYLKRYARQAWERGDLETLARVHNGGPKGASKRATLSYWHRVQKALQTINNNKKD